DYCGFSLAICLHDEKDWNCMHLNVPHFTLFICVEDSGKITSGSFSELDELARYLNENPSFNIQLEGHTEKDRAQNAAANLRLSQARVDAVKEYLVKKKVKKNRILTKAFGGTQPKFEGDTDKAKAQNRRVEVRFIRK
ncbi:MAG: OmpA family protein, partial [Bacteroidota bacterium]